MVCTVIENIWDPAHIVNRRVQFHSKIAEYFDTENFTDVNITCWDEETVFKCHRLALAAASDYFEVMFRSGFKESQAHQDIELQNIDSATFKHILQFVYRGEVVDITDDNVYSLLLASDFFGLKDIENHCLHYLIEKNIPMDHALQIHSYACTMRKESLVPVTSHFILRHLNHLRRNSEFLKMPFGELSLLLKYFKTSSTSAESVLLRTILQWVRNSTDIDEDVKASSFAELVSKVRFEYISPPDITDYFNAHFASVDEDNDVEMLDTSDTNLTAHNNNCEKLSLHVFVATDFSPDSSDDASASSRSSIGEAVSVFSLESRGNNDFACFLSCVIQPSIGRLRICESNGRLYILAWRDETWSFSSSTAVDLSTDLQSLPLPLHLDPHRVPIVYPIEPRPFGFSNLTMCSLENNIYLFGEDEVRVDFQYYNRDIGTWSLFPGAYSDVLKPVRMTSDDQRLYVIFHRSMDVLLPVFAAYDPRVGKLEKLSAAGLKYFDPGVIECCSHGNGIYVTDYDDYRRSKPAHQMRIYQPSADKWILQELQVDYTNHVRFRYGHQLVSFNNNLWMLGFFQKYVPCFTIYSQMYDSYEQRWDTRNLSLIQDTINDTGFNTDEFEDIIVFKSLI